MTFQSQKDLQNSGFLASDAAKKYENAENATLPFAKILIEKSGLANLDGEAHILDFACGIGAVIKALYDAVPLQKRKDLKVLGADVSPPMLDYLTARGEKEGWAGLTTMVVNGNVSFPLDFPTLDIYHTNVMP
jgi:ubiquinone/menaquinone biosynthesis C-methylase UbiE